MYMSLILIKSLKSCKTELEKGAGHLVTAPWVSTVTDAESGPAAFVHPNLVTKETKTAVVGATRFGVFLGDIYRGDYTCGTALLVLIPITAAFDRGWNKRPKSNINVHRFSEKKLICYAFVFLNAILLFYNDD